MQMATDRAGEGRLRISGTDEVRIRGYRWRRDQILGCEPADPNTIAVLCDDDQAQLFACALEDGDEFEFEAQLMPAVDRARPRRSYRCFRFSGVSAVGMRPSEDGTEVTLRYAEYAEAASA
jgi:hypothetical protein